MSIIGYQLLVCLKNNRHQIYHIFELCAEVSETVEKNSGENRLTTDALNTKRGICNSQDVISGLWFC